jgi:hypothetical protein
MENRVLYFLLDHILNIIINLEIPGGNMSKKEYLISKLKGQIEEWESEINRLKCDIDVTLEEKVKKECSHKISKLQLMISEAQEEVIRLDIKFKDSDSNPPAPPYLE